MFSFSNIHAIPKLLLGFFLCSFPAWAHAAIPFEIKTIALTADDGLFGPALGPGVSFIGFNGSPILNSSGNVAFPGTTINANGDVAKGFWLDTVGGNDAIVLTNDDGVLGPGLGPGIVFDNVVDNAYLSDGGEVIIGGFLSGSGVDNSNGWVWSKHAAGVNVPFAREGVANDLGPGLGGDEHYSGFFIGPQINSENLVLFQATIAGSAIDTFNDLGLWKHSSAGNIAVARTGDTSAVGPGLGADTVFTPYFTSERVLDGSGEVVFSGLAQNLGTGARDIGLWRNDGTKNVAFVLSGNTGNLGPGLGDSRSFADGSTQSFLEFDTNQQNDVIFLAKLDDGTGGIWRNSGPGNQAVAIAGQSNILGPGLGTQDTFADFDPRSEIPMW